MESLRHYLAVTLVILLSLAGVGHAQVPSMAARSLSLASPPNAKVPFASLTNSNIVPQVNGTITFCSDCNQTPVCAAGGTGALAELVNNAWQCGLGTSQTGTVSINPGMAGQVGGYVTGGSTISPLTSIQGANVNGVLNAQTFGAKGDGVHSGDGVRLADGTTNGSTTFTSPSGHFTAGLTGDQIFIEKAGTSGGTYVGAVASVTNATTLILSSIPPNAVAATASYVIGFDNTTALNAWAAAMRSAVGTGVTPSGYVPVGTYLHRGVDLGMIPGVQITGAGAGVMGPNSSMNNTGTSMLCVAPTTTPKICHDFSGDTMTTIRDMSFANGIDDATSGGAGSVNALFARMPTGANYFGILNQVQSVFFRSNGGPSAYGVVIYGWEQTDWLDDVFNYDQDTAKAIYLTQLNTPGFTSPNHGALAPSPNSTTSQTFMGGKWQVSSNSCPGGVQQCVGTTPAAAAITIDGAVADVNLIGGFYRLNGPNDVLIADTTSTSVAGDWQLIGMRGETGSNNPTVGNSIFNLQGTWQDSSVIGGGISFLATTTARSTPDFQARAIIRSNFQNYRANVNTWNGGVYQVLCTGTNVGYDNYFGNINRNLIGGCLSNVADNNVSNTFSGIIAASTYLGDETPSFTGGVTVGSGHQTSTTGEIQATGTSITLTPGFSCAAVSANVVGIVVDGTAQTIPLMTGRTATTLTWTAVVGHNYDYAGMSCG